jgi:Zn-dependent protease
VTFDEQRWLPPQTPAGEPAGDRDAFGNERPKGDDQRKRGIGGGIIAAILVALSKGKALLLLLPKLKLLTTSGSMLVSIAAYSLIWGWKFAVGFVILLFVHEMGHVIQLRREGIEASAPLFIPFLGAVVWGRMLEGNALAEARVGLAGPILGSIGAAVCWAIGAGIDSDFWRALAFIGFFLNLFNLAPVTPLDGGRAVAALTPWMWFVGLFLVAVLAFAYPNPIIFLILIMGALDVHRRWKARHEQGEYYKVSPRNRAIVAVVYIGLIIALAIGLDLTHLARDLNDV